jgi:hypothetical protein
MKPDGEPWPVSPVAIAVLAGVLPLLAVTGAYLVNRYAGYELEPRFACFPFTEGCVSISRAVRSGPGLHLFRAVMLPTSVVLFLTWACLRAWLLGLGLCSARRAGWVLGMGALGALFLVVYATWLGTEGEWYEWLRRYGVTFYFAGTAFAQLLLLWILWPQRRGVAGGRLAAPVTWLAVLVGLQWVLGVFSSVKRLVFDDPALIDRIENVIEWWYAVPMVLAFLVVAALFGRTGFHLQARFR